MEDKPPKIIDGVPEWTQLKGDLAPNVDTGTATTKLIGSLAPPLAKHTTPPDLNELPELNYGVVRQVTNKPVTVKSGESAQITLPNSIDHHIDGPSTKILLHLGGVPVSIRPISHEEIRRKTTEGGEGFMQRMIEQRGGVLLNIDGTEIAVEDLELEDFYNPRELPLERLPQEGLEKSEANLNELKAALGDPEHSRSIDKMIQELRQRDEHNKKIKEKAMEDAEDKLKEATIRIAIGRKTKRDPGSEDEDFLTLTPIGIAASLGKVKFLKPIDGVPHKDPIDIPTSGIYLEEVSDVLTVSSKHLTLELKDGQLTLIDGDGQKVSSTNATRVEPIVK